MSAAPRKAPKSAPEKPAAKKPVARRPAATKTAARSAAAPKPTPAKPAPVTAPPARPAAAPAVGPVEVCPRCGTTTFGPEERTRWEGRRTVRFSVLVCERGHTFARPVLKPA